MRIIIEAEERAFCPFCAGYENPAMQEILTAKDYISHSVDIDGAFLRVSCSTCASEGIAAINYCPMCGRKLRD